jgi:hypothetical protein
VSRRFYRNVEKAFALPERWEEARARWVAEVLGISPTDAEARTWSGSPRRLRGQLEHSPLSGGLARVRA